MAERRIIDELDRMRHELGELEELIPRTAPDGPAHANLRGRAEKLSQQIRKVEHALEELRELEQVTADLEEGSSLRRSLSPRISELRRELDEVGHDLTTAPNEQSAAGREGAAGKLSTFLRDRRSQQIASTLIAVGFFLPWFDLLLFQVSGYTLVRFLFGLDQFLTSMGSLLDVEETPNTTVISVAVSVLLLLVVAAAASALIPKRRVRGIVAYVACSLLVPMFVVPLTSADALSAASVGLVVFGSGLVLGLASGATTTLDTHTPVGARRRRTLQAFFAVAGLVLGALLLFATETPEPTLAVVVLAWFAVAAYVLIPKASPEEQRATDKELTTRTIRDWWRERWRIALTVAAGLAVVAAAGAGVWWWLTAPVEGPLEIAVSRQRTADRSTENGLPGVTVTSMDKRTTVEHIQDSEDLIWNVEDPIRIEVTPPWPTYDEALTETIALADLGVDWRNRGDTITVRVRFQEQASLLDVSLESGAVLLAASADRATAEDREAIEEQQRAIEREEQAAAREAAEACRQDILAVYEPLFDFRRVHRELTEQHWPEETALYTVWFDRATNILNGLHRPIETAGSAGPTGARDVDRRAFEAVRAIDDLYLAWLSVRQASQRQDDNAFRTANEEVWDVERRFGRHLTSLTSAARTHCRDNA